jgi:hypothetical protein
MIFQHQSGLQGGLGFGILISIRITRTLRLWYFNISPDYKEAEVMVIQHRFGLQGG